MANPIGRASESRYLGRRRVSRAPALVLAVSLVIALVGMGQVHADLVTYDFSGTVSVVDPSLSGTFAPSQTLTGSFTYDTATAPRAGSTSQFGVFDALKSVQFAVGGYSASSSAASELQVDDNPGAPNHDRFGLVSRATDGLTGAAVNGNTLGSFGFRLDDSTDTAFNTALTLPTTLSLSSFDSNAFFIFFNPPSGDPVIVSGTLSTLTASGVPEPGGFIVLGSGLVVCLAVARRHRAMAKPA